MTSFLFQRFEFYDIYAQLSKKQIKYSYIITSQHLYKTFNVQ